MNAPGARALAGIVLWTALCSFVGIARAEDRVPPGNLQLLRSAVEKAAVQALEGLPLSQGDTITLKARKKDDPSRAMWEEVLIEQMTKRGFLVQRELEVAAGPTGEATPPDTTLAGKKRRITDMAMASSDTGNTVQDSGAAGLATEAPEVPSADTLSVDAAAPEISSDAGIPAETHASPLLQFESVDLGLVYTHASGGRLFGDATLDRRARAAVFLELSAQSGDAIFWSGRGESSIGDQLKSGRLDSVASATLPCPPPKWEEKGFFSRIAEPALVVGIVSGLVYLFYANRAD